MHKAFTITLALAAFLANAIGKQSQQQPKPHHTRASAVEQALATNKDLASARVAIARAEARLKATGLKPSLKIELQYESDLLFGNDGEKSYGLAIAKTFPNARRLTREKELTRFQIQSAKLEVKQKENELIAKVSNHALDIHIVDTRISHLRETLAKLDQNVSFVSQKVDSGELSPFELSQLTLEKRILEQKIADLSVSRERFIHRLAPLINEESAEHFEFDAVDALPYTGTPLPGFDTDCLARSPLYQASILQEQVADAKTQHSLAQAREDPTGRLFWKNERGIDQPVGKTSDHLLGFALSIPLPSPKNASLRSQESLREKDQARLTAAALRFRIKNDIEHARHEAIIYQKRMREYQEQVLAYADQQLQDMQSAYQNGQIDMLTLLRTQEQRLSLIDGYIDLYQENAHARLELQLTRNERL